jgi:hypothetical protein
VAALDVGVVGRGLVAPTVEEALRRALARPIGSGGGTEATRAKIFTGAPAGARRIARACVRSHPCVLSVSLCAAGLPSWLFVILAPDGGALAGKPLPRGKWCPKAEHAAAGLLAALRGLLPHLEEVGPGDPSAHPLAIVARAVRERLGDALVIGVNALRNDALSALGAAAAADADKAKIVNY